MKAIVNIDKCAILLVVGLFPYLLKAQLINSSGVVDITFSTALPGSWGGGGINNVAPTGVSEMTITEDGQIITAGGGTTTYRRQNKVILLNKDGETIKEIPRQLPAGYNSSKLLFFQKDRGSVEAIYKVGEFGPYDNISIARFLPDGAIDSTFSLSDGFTVGENGIINFLGGTVDSSDRVIIFGDFNTYNKIPINRILRIKGNGELDRTFDVGSGPSSIPFGIASGANGGLFVWGGFDTFNGGNHPYLVLLHSDGTIVDNFDQANFVDQIPSAFLHAVPLNDAKVLIGGFQSRNIDDPHIIRLNPDGTIDSTFNGRFDIDTGFIQGIRELENGQFLVWGTFQKGIILFSQNGSIDESFDTGFGPRGVHPSIQGVYSVEKYNDTTLLAGGHFMSFDGHASQALARINFKWPKSSENLGPTENEDILSNLPDLIISNVTADSKSIMAGDSILVRITVQNIGNFIAGESTTRIRLTNDSRLTKHDILPLNADISTPSIGAGELVELTHEISIPETTPANRYYIGAFADSHSSIGQENEANDAGLSLRKITVNRIGDRPVLETAEQVTITTNEDNEQEFSFKFWAQEGIKHTIQSLDTLTLRTRGIVDNILGNGEFLNARFRINPNLTSEFFIIGKGGEVEDSGNPVIQPSHLVFETYPRDHHGEIGGDRSPNWKPHELNIDTRQKEAEHYHPFRKCVAHVWDGKPINLAKYLEGYSENKQLFEDEAFLKWRVNEESAGFIYDPEIEQFRVEEFQQLNVEVALTDSLQVVDHLIITVISEATITEFDKWHRDNSDLSWLDDLPVPYQQFFFEVEDIVGITVVTISDPEPEACEPQRWQKVDVQNDFYHPGGFYKMRSKVGANGSGHQAIFDEHGKLITSGISAGSADRGAPLSLSNRTTDHVDTDVRPFIWALQIDGNPVGPRAFPLKYFNLTAPALFEGYNLNRYFDRRPPLISNTKLIPPGTCQASQE